MWLGLVVLAAALSVLSLLWKRERSERLRLSGELQDLEGQISSMAVRDKLTGLLTRTGFDAILDQEVQKTARSGEPFCLLYIALDNFRLLNDAFGSDVGDRLLRDASRRLTACTGTAETACRVAAGEFALGVRGGAENGRVAASHVLEAFAQPFEFDINHTHLSCSIGIAVFPEHGPRSDLLGHAALAMRSAKLNGGGDFFHYEFKMGFDAREQAMLVHDLRSALEFGQFELYFQPKIDALSLQVTAAEALLRWHHPERGLVPPDLFIPLAERFGLMSAIGNWVIEQACYTAARWNERGLRMRVAVNISAYQMRQDDLVERIQTSLNRYGIEPTRFTYEITESVAMQDTKVTLLTFDKMRTAGVQVSIDDFGTGYSSLAVLRRLPAAELKIDRAFVTDLETSEDARSIAQSIVNLATALKLRVVAEGVETVGQCEILVEMGCHELQGFLFSRAIPADELERLALRDPSENAVRFRRSLYTQTIPARLEPSPNSLG